MLGASLTAAETVKKKGETRQHVGPSGKVYKSDHDLTPAERKQIDAYDLSQYGSVKLGGKFDPSIRPEPKADANSVRSFFASQNADKKTPGPINPKAIAKADKSMQLANRRNAKGQHLDTKGNVIPDYDIKTGIAISDTTQKAIADVLGPVSDFLGGVVGEMSSANRVPGGKEMAKKLTGDALAGIINTPVDLAANAGNMLFAKDNSLENILRSGANIGAQLLPIEAIPGFKAVKNFLKSGEGVADDFAKAIGKGAEDVSGIPKRSLVDVPKAKTPAETVKPTQGQKEPWEMTRKDYESQYPNKPSPPHFSESRVQESVYHGSESGDIKQFFTERGKLGGNTNSAMARLGAFFSEDADIARKAALGFSQKSAVGRADAPLSLYEVKLNLHNPLDFRNLGPKTIDFLDKNFPGFRGALHGKDPWDAVTLIAKNKNGRAILENEGYDGIVFRTMVDSGSNLGPKNQYVAFHPESIHISRKSPAISHEVRTTVAAEMGKPVPKEVLADYPDLAAKYGKKEPAVSTRGMTGEPDNLFEHRDALWAGVKDGRTFKDTPALYRTMSGAEWSSVQKGNKIGPAPGESAVFVTKDVDRISSGSGNYGGKSDGGVIVKLKDRPTTPINSRNVKGLVEDGIDEYNINDVVAVWDSKTGKKIYESPNASAPTPNTPKPIEAPQKPVQSPETGNVEATGIANQVLDREAAQGLINEVEKGTGKNAEHWQKEGQKAVQAGQDPVSLARRIANGEEDPTPLKFGILQEGKAILQRRLNNAAPGKDFDEALSKMDEYLADVQSGKGIWSDMGRALQAGTDLDTGNFAQVIERVQKQGGKLNPKMEEQLRDMTEKVKAAEAKLSETERLLKEEQAKRTTASQAKKSPRFSKEALDEELDQLLKEFVQKTAKASAGIDPELLPIMGRIAVNYMKRGVNTLDDVVAAVQSHFKEATYEDIVSGIDAATKGTTRTRSELQKEITRLKSQAKSDVKARTQIKSLQEQLRTGDYEVPTKRESTITKRVEDLRLERDLLSNEVKSRVGETKPRTGWQTVTNVLNAPKSIKSSIDISAAGRQGWFLGAANPDKIPAAFADQLKAMASPKGALKAQNALLERPNASKYKRMGLYIAPLEGHGEEAFKGTVFPKWSKLNPFQGSSRAYTAYLNRMRVDVADRLIKWAGPNATDDDLKVIGNFINTASGRGGKSIHLEGKIAESLNNVFFSPRFVASRFELALGQPLMTAQGKLGKSLKARALVAQQYAATLGTIGSIVALAKHMNPDMNTTDPTKPDYMSPKIGDTKIDVLAGLRQTVNLGAKLLDRDRNEFQKGADVGRFIRSKASPAAGSAYSLYTGKDYIGQPYGIKDALTDLVSPLSVQELVEGAKKDGWNQDDFLGMLNFLGFNTQTYKPKEDKKEHPN